MQFRIKVKSEGGAWIVEAENLQTSAPVVNPADNKPFKRLLGKVGEGAKTFPQPPAGEAAAIADTPDNPHRELCVTEDADVIQNIYRNILSRNADDVVRFGRYLFATLLGDALWDELNRLAPAEPLELCLAWENSENLINRLPWEMMRSQDNFLAAEPQVVITRRVADTSQKLSEITSPRVLFVVGSDWTKDPNVRPGAEYLGLLRCLKPSASVRLKTHLLLQASPKRIKAAVQWFRPTVVHFICHGIIDPQKGSVLKLMKDDSGGVEHVNGGDLLKILRPVLNIPLPQIVVLNACYTASDSPDQYLKPGQVASPIAVQLVKGDERGEGVPIVVGMAGQVSDQACRLFTRCFYEALLNGDQIAQAAAAGRQVGIIEDGLTNPTESVDWAMPTLFMSDGVEEPRLIIKPHEVEIDWHGIAHEFAPGNYPAFCDRLGFFEWFDYLMAETGANLPPPEPHAGDLQLIAVSLGEKDKKNKDVQLGRTWLLREFAAQAVLDGHIPCLIDNEWFGRGKSEYPDTFEGLIDDFRRAMTNTAKAFKLMEGPQPYFTAECLNLLEEVKSGKAKHENLPIEIQQAYNLDKTYDGPQVRFTALRLDLLRLLQKAREQRPEEERARTKLLLLIDDVHQMDNATKDLLNFFKSLWGLRSTSAETPGAPVAKSDIRVICTYDLSRGLGVEKNITEWLEKARGAKEIPLRVFQKPEDQLAYQFFLSGWKDQMGNIRPLALKTKASPEFIKTFFAELEAVVEGIPSQLKSIEASSLIGIYLRLPPEGQVLGDVNDEALINLIPMLRRGM